MKTIIEKSGADYRVYYFNEDEKRWRYVFDSLRHSKFFAKRLAKKISIEGLPKIRNEIFPIAIFENGEQI